MSKKTLTRTEKLVELAQKRFQDSDLKVVVLPANIIDNVVVDFGINSSNNLNQDIIPDQNQIRKHVQDSNAKIYDYCGQSLEALDKDKVEVFSDNVFDPTANNNIQYVPEINAEIHDYCGQSLKELDKGESGNISDASRESDEYNPPSEVGNTTSTDSEEHCPLAEIRKREKLRKVKENGERRSKKGRKRKFPDQTFKLRKKLRDSNLLYYSVNGQRIEPKSFVNFDCNCKMKCQEKVAAVKREELFKNFWDLGSYDTQTAFLAATVQVNNIKRKRIPNSTQRGCTRIYKLGNDVVCREMFIKTYQISTKRIHTAVTKLTTSDRLRDKRGKKAGGLNKITENTKDAVLSHIALFPTYVSHYTREKTDAKFLKSDLSIPKMHSLYLSENNPAVSLSAYKKIFYENFNLRRKPPIKDTCNICDIQQAKLQNTSLNETRKEEIKSVHLAHLNKAKEARGAMKADFSAANKTHDAISYDMQKVLSLPRLPTNITYYKRQLSVYNEGIHSASTNTPYCFLWKEGVAGRGAQEVGSCIKLFIEKYLDPNVEELIMWSDSCGGQNRNVKIILLLKAVLSRHKTLKTIIFKYIIPGHSFLPNDTDFGEIERALKHQIRVYTMEDFKTIILSCKKSNKFVVSEMCTDHFFSIEDIENTISNRKVLETGEKVDWLNARVIKIEKEKPYSIFFKHSHVGDDYKELKIEKRMKGIKQSLTGNFQGKLKILYPAGKPISQKKAADIQSLMSLVPEECKQFYNTNIETAEFQKDLEGFGPDIDFELEEN